MFQLNEEKLNQSIVEQAVDQLLTDDSLCGLVEKEVKKRIDAIFKDRADAAIAEAIDRAVSNGFEREYQRVNSWGQPDGEPTTIKNELEKTVSNYWAARVDSRTGKPAESSYSSVTRAEYLMTQICAEDFTNSMRQAATNVTGALKDGLRTQIAMQMDNMLSELFKVKSLQDQGKVDKAW